MNSLKAAALAVIVAVSGFAQSGPAEAHSSYYKHKHKAKYSCGWYAISVCSKSYYGAKKGTHHFGGRVINTSHSAYPNFRNGWYCAVRGPFYKKHRAHHVKRKMRDHGAYSAYVKRAC